MTVEGSLLFRPTDLDTYRMYNQNQFHSYALLSTHECNKYYL